MSFSAKKTARVFLAWRRFGPRRSLHKTLTRQRIALCWSFAVFFVAARITPAPAQSEIDIEPRVGFHGVFQLGRPFPLEVELSNRGRPADGALEVQVWKGGAMKGGAPYLANYRREIFLPAQARKTVQLTVDPDFISRPLTIRFNSANAEAVREVDLRRHFSPTPVLLLMSGSGIFPPLTLSGAGQGRLVSVAPTELAGDSRALLGVSHLILYDQSLRDLSRAQLLALEGWLLAGGHLVVIGSLNYALYQEPALARFLPVRVNGVRQIVFSSDAAKASSAVSLAGVWAQSANVVSGKTLAESDGIPVLVEASRGRGRVLYIALDVGRPPLAHWTGLANFPSCSPGPTPRSRRAAPPT
jgi:hypothetical protein